MNEKLKVIIICIVIFSITFASSIFVNSLKWDSTQYLRIAKWLAYEKEEMLVTLWLPLISFIKAGFFQIFGIEYGIIVTKFLYLFLISLTPVFIYLIARKLAPENAWISCLGAFVFPYLYWSTKLYLDPLACFFTLVGIYFYIFKENKQTLSGIFFGLAILTKFFFIIFILPVIILFGEKKRKLTCIIIISLLLIPWLVFSAIKFSNPFFILFRTYFTYSTFSVKTHPLTALLEIFKILLILFPIFIYFSIKKRDKFSILLWIYLISFLLLPGVKEIRYIIPFLLLCIIYLSQLPKKIYFPAILIMFLVNFNLFIYFQAIDFICSDKAIKEAGGFIKNLEGEIYANDFWPQLSWYSEKNVRYYGNYKNSNSYVIFVNEKPPSNCNKLKTFKDNCFIVHILKC